MVDRCLFRSRFLWRGVFAKILHSALASFRLAGRYSQGFTLSGGDTSLLGDVASGRLYFQGGEALQAVAAEKGSAILGEPRGELEFRPDNRPTHENSSFSRFF
jgi:hypothetical protein